MKIIAITGSIATGKSFAANCFVELGAKLFDADKIVHEIMLSDNNAIKAISEIFPTSLINNKIDRKILGAIIFQDNSKRELLENIIYPILDKKREQFLNASRENNVKIVVMEIPLLFEKNKQDICDYIIVTKIDEETQIRRALARKNMSLEKFHSINNLQMPTDEKIKQADFVIDTAINELELKAQIKLIIKHVNGGGERI